MAFSDTETYYLDHTLTPPQWRSYIDDHLVVGTTPPPPRTFGDPGDGNLYYGATVDSLAARETYVGARLGATRRYYQIDTSDNAVSACAGDLAQTRVPWISFKLKIGSSEVATWAQFAAGTQDAWFSGMLADLNAIGKGPILLTLHAEPNGDGQSAADHQAMYAHAKTMTDAYPQILLTPCLSWNYFDVAVGSPTAPKVVYADWCLDVNCDVRGFNSYNHASWNPVASPPKKNLTVQQVFGLQAAQLNSTSNPKPWAVSEWGVRTNPTSAGAAATQMQGLFDFARQNGCIVMTFFDSSLNVNDGGSPWDLDDTTDGTSGVERIAQFKTTSLLPHAVHVPAGGIPV